MTPRSRQDVVKEVQTGRVAGGVPQVKHALQHRQAEALIRVWNLPRVGVLPLLRGRVEGLALEALGGLDDDGFERCGRDVAACGGVPFPLGLGLGLGLGLACGGVPFPARMVSVGKVLSY